MLRPYRAYIAAALLLALILLEYLPAPYPLTPAAIHPFYRQLSQDPAEYALLELPLQPPEGQWYYTHWMLEQTVHGKPSFRGYISRGDPLFPFEGAPFFRQLVRLGPAEDIHYDNFHDLARVVLSHYRVGYIILERPRLEERGRFDDTRVFIQEVLGPTRPAYEDSELIAYQVDWGPVVPFLRLGQGWHEVEAQEWGPFRWIERDQAEVYIVVPEAREVVLEFQAVSFLRPRRLQIWSGEKPVAELEIGTALQRYRLQVQLPAGETRLEWRAEGYDVPARLGVGPDPRAVSIGVSTLRLR